MSFGVGHAYETSFHMLAAEKSVIVTGGATGIGAGIAAAFLTAGFSVAIDYVGDPAPAQAFASAHAAAGERLLTVEADISNAADVQKLVDATIKQFGKVDILINNAGIEHRYPFVDTPDHVWDQILAVNLTGPFLCSRAAARQMIAQGGGGRIINISSIHEEITAPTNAPYCATKGGLQMLMRTIAVELAPHNITVNNVAPGAIDTPMDAATKNDKKTDAELMAEIPLGRWGTPADIAAMCLFLCSDGAGYITGTSMVIDGGMMRQAGSL